MAEADDVRNGLDQAFGKTPAVVVAEEPEIEDDPEEEEPEETPEEETPAEEVTPEATPEIPEEIPEAPTTEVDDAPESTFDASAWLKEQTGYDDLETVKAELEAYRALKDAPPPEPKFANEDSKRVYDLLVAGEVDKVTEILTTNKLLKDADKLSTEEKLKLHLKLQYPDFDDEDVEAQFQKEYGFDEDEIDESLIKSEKKKHAATLKVAAAKADEFFKSKQTQIELPTIQPTQQAEPAGPTQEQLDNSQKWVDNFNQNLSKLKPEHATYKTHFSDEANKMQFDVAFVPDAKGFEAAKEATKDISGWLDKNFLDKEGNLNVAKLTQLIYQHENADKVNQAVLVQAKNSILRWQLANGKQIDLKNGGQRNYSQAAPISEVENVRQKVFG